MNLNTTITLVTLFVILVLGLVVLFENYKGRINDFFFLLCLFIAIWILNNFLSDHVNNVDIALLLSRFALVWVSFIPILFSQLITELYYSRDLNYKKVQERLRFVSFVVTTVIILFSQTSLNIRNVRIESWGLDYDPGFLYYIFFLYLLLSFGFSFYYLLRVRRNGENIARVQANFIIIGAYITVLFTILFNIISPLLGYGMLNILGPSSVIIFVTFTSIAILKHRLFSVRVIATELLVFLLWIIILIRTLISSSTQDTIVNLSLLVGMIILGILLIRSVIKEVSQRERIEKLAGDLQKANDRLTELDKQKSEFVSFATHQLRAPLTAMKGYASLILEGDLGKLSSEIKEAITRIYDSSNTLASIVNDYLNISRIELGSMKYTFEEVDLKDLIKNVLYELKPNIDESIAKNIKFSVNIDQSKKYDISADRDKFKQIIGNLVDNAIKYTPSGAVTVGLTNKNHKILFSVKDSGIGIDPEVMPKLFSKFSRADNANMQNIHGTGLGLYVAKEIVTAHKGRIWAESAGEGKGSTFFVELDEVA